MKESNPMSFVAFLAAMGGIAGSFAIIAWGNEAQQSVKQRIATLIASAMGGFLIGLPTGIKFGMKWFNVRSPDADELMIYSFAACVGGAVFILTFLVGGIAKGLSTVDWGKVFWHFLDSIRPPKDGE